MRRLFKHSPWLMLIALTILPGQLALGECEQHGTSVDFYDTPAEAAKEAKKKEKLVFVLHVSGVFEESEYT